MWQVASLAVYYTGDKNGEISREIKVARNRKG
jgi:hypothetical protein